MKYKAVIFDLDGTLLDSLTDLADACNIAIGRFGVEPIALDRYRYLVGQGVTYLVEHALGPAKREHLEEAIALHRETYAQCMYDNTRPYDGVGALLDGLHKQDVRTAILSNKPQDATEQVVGRLLSDWPFAAVWGHRAGFEPKPDPASAAALIQELGVTPGEVVYVGDTKVDMLTGKAAGFFTIGVTWGFRDRKELVENGADVIVDHPPQLLEQIEAA